MRDYAIGGEKWEGMCKLIEEFSELQNELALIQLALSTSLQTMGKLIQLDGGIIHWDGIIDKERLIEELGDARASMIFFCEMNDISKEAVHKRADYKLALFKQWSEERKNDIKSGD